MPLLAAVGVEVGVTYNIVGPDGTVATLNDPTSPTFVGFLNGEDGVTGLERAGVRESADLLPEADGGRHGAFRYDRLSFTLKGIIPPDAAAGGTWLERQDRLMRATDAMRDDARLYWTTSTGADLELYFRQQQPTRLSGRRPKAFLVAGVAEQNVIRAQALSTLLLTLGVVGVGGLRSPITSPLSSGASSVGAGTANVGGRSEAWPLITITGPIVNPVVSSLRTGQSLRLNYTLAAGESLILDADPRRRSIRLNGSANRYSALDWTSSSWWPLLPGANEIIVGASSYSAGASVLVAWRDTIG